MNIRKNDNLSNNIYNQAFKSGEYVNKTKRIMPESVFSLTNNEQLRVMLNWTKRLLNNEFAMPDSVRRILVNESGDTMTYSLKGGVKGVPWMRLGGQNEHVTIYSDFDNAELEKTFDELVFVYGKVLKKG